MAGVVAATQSFLGELFQSSKRPNTFLRLIGGIQGQVKETSSRQFPIGAFYNLRNPAQAVALEGANAPAAQSRTLSQTTNVIEIHQEAVSLTYLAESDKTVSGVVPLPMGSANGPVQNPRTIEFQVQTALDTVAQDLNYAFLQGVYVNPADPTSTALSTRGILTAITTNSFDQSADMGTTAASYRAYVNKLMMAVVTTTGYNPDDTWCIMAGATEFSNIAAAFEALGTIYLQPESEVAGVKIRKIMTRFGTLMLALDPDMPAQYFAIFDLGVVGPVGMPVPQKGILFYEALAKVGSAEQGQIYGQMGLDHGPEYCHGKLKVPAGISL